MQEYNLRFLGSPSSERLPIEEDIKIPDNEDQAILDGTLQNIFPHGSADLSDEGRCLALMRYVSNALLLKNNTGPATKMLQDGYAYCGGMANSVRMLARRMGLPARFVGAFCLRPCHGSHAMTEVFYDKRWHLLDATYGLFFYSKDTYDERGVIASYSDLLADHQSWTPFQVVEMPWTGKYDPTNNFMAPARTDYLEDMYGTSIVKLHGKYAEETFPVAFGEGDAVSFPVDADLRKDSKFAIGEADGDMSDVVAAMSLEGFHGSHYLGGWTPPGFHTWWIRLPAGCSRLHMTYHSVRDNPPELAVVPLRSVHVVSSEITGRSTVFALRAVGPEVILSVFSPKGGYIVDAMEVERH